MALAFTLLLLVPAGAEGGQGQEDRFMTFAVNGTNGYKMVAWAIPPPPHAEAQEGALGLFLTHGKTAEVTYGVRSATVTATSIEADLSGLGRIAVTRRPTGRTRTLHAECLPGHEGREEVDRYRGTIEFHGEEGFTEIDAAAARGALGPLCGIPEGGRPPGKSLPGARLAVSREVGEDFQTSFSAVQGRPGGQDADRR